KESDMNWIALENLLDQNLQARPVTLSPALDHAELRLQALRLAGGLQARGVRRVAVPLEDAAELAVALLAAWRAGVSGLLPADLRPASRARQQDQAALWQTDHEGDTRLEQLFGQPLDGDELDLDQCHLVLCTGGSSGEPKLIDKRL